MGGRGRRRSVPFTPRKEEDHGTNRLWNHSQHVVVKAIHVVERDRLRRADSPDAAVPSQETSDPASTFSALGRLSAKLKVE